MFSRFAQSSARIWCRTSGSSLSQLSSSLYRQRATASVKCSFMDDRASTMRTSSAKSSSGRFLLYDVNPGEGVNLRRDVYMRVANLVKFLNEEEPWTLVLPPWGRLYHWQTPNLHQMKIPWGTFFDLPSLNRHVPVMELTDYFKVLGEAKVEAVYYLQQYAEGWKDGHFEEKMDIRPCLGDTGFFQEKDDDRWYGWFYSYEQMYAEKFECISIQGHAAFMKPFLLHNTTARSVYLENAEQLLHGIYSEFSPEFWTARRSMRYAKHLRQIGDEFREKYLDSTDEKDRTVLGEDWTAVQKQHGEALGGPYIAVHLRRKDYVRAHPEDVPSLKNAAKQIKAKLKKHKLDKVFIATDAPAKEFEELKGYLSEHSVYRFVPTESQLKKYKDGGVTIIDQWIAAHARYFLGTHVSTVSFRIHEDREILGFDPDMTFNCLCGNKRPKCDQPTQWKILY